MIKINSILKPFFICIFLLLNTHIAFAQSPFELVKKSHEAMRGTTYYGVSTLKITRPDWTRTLSFKNWAKGSDYSLILITAPAKDKGVASLLRENEMWNWIPNIQRTVKISNSMLNQSWMGSDITNDNMINQASIVTDYNHELIRSDQVDGNEVWVVNATAKPDAPVVWDKVTLWIDKTHFFQRKMEYYDEFGELVNVFNSSNVQEMGGRFIPTYLEMIPVDKVGHKTSVTINSVQFDFELEDAFFSIEQMKRLSQ